MLEEIIILVIAITCSRVVWCVLQAFWADMTANTVQGAFFRRLMIGYWFGFASAYWVLT